MFLSRYSGIHLAPPTSLMVPPTLHSPTHRPGVVGRGVVVVVVVVVVVEEAAVDTSSVELVWDVAALAASKSFSMEIGVVDGVGHPVNSVVALRKLPDVQKTHCVTAKLTSTAILCESKEQSGRPVPIRPTWGSSIFDLLRV